MVVMKLNHLVRLLFPLIRTSYWLAILILLLLSSGSLSAQVKFYTVLSEKKVRIDQTFQVQYVVEGTAKVEKFSIPEYPEFDLEEVFDVPSAARRSTGSQQVVRGVTRVAVLSPKKIGRFAIRPASAMINGISMKSNTVNVVVVGNSYTQDDQEPEVEDQSEIKPGETIEQKIRENFFLTAEVNKRTCYVGEPIVAIYKACSRLNANSQVVRRPSLTGFSVTEMVDTYDGQADIEQINGVPFYVHLIRKVQLFPLQEGTYELDGAEVESVIHFYRDNNRIGDTRDLQELMDRIESPRNPTVIPHHLTLKTRPLTITVKPLPLQGQPQNFSGAVGNFTVSSSVDGLKMKRGSQATVSFTVSGTGNFPLVTAPDVEWPPTLIVADGGVSEQTNKYVYPLNGSKTFSFVVTADKPGTYAIPAASFSYFDPQKHQYTELTTAPVTLEVSEADVVRAPEETGKSSSGNIHPKYLWFIPVVIIILGLICYQLFFGAGKKKPVETQETQPQGKEVAESHLAFAAADFALAAGDRAAFYESISRQLWQTSADVSNVSPSSLNKQNLSLVLSEKNVEPAAINELKLILNECEWALYTPDVTNADMVQLRSRAESIHRELIKHL